MKKGYLLLTLFFILVITFPINVKADFVSIDLSGVATSTFRDPSDPFWGNYPEGSKSFNGIPFYIIPYPNNSIVEVDPGNPVAIGVNLYGVTSMYSLINTYFGIIGGPYAYIEFIGKNGSYYRKDLYGDIDIRDWMLSDYTNSINGTTTVNAFTYTEPNYENDPKYHQIRLDMQIIQLPDSFKTDILEKVVFYDLFDSPPEGDEQQIFLAGLTAAATPIPEPATMLLLGSGLLGLVGLRRKFRK